MYQIIAYIKFLLRSRNQHGVHSPFIYDFVTKCLYDQSKHEAYLKLLEYRKTLLRNTKTIDVTDFGSGSRVFKSNKRTIRAIAQKSGTPLRRAKLFYRLVTYFKPKTTLELGTSLGITTHAMALGSFQNKIISIEGCPEISLFAKLQLKKFDIDNATINTGVFKDILPKLNDTNYDLVFFDGHHDKQATIVYFESLLQKVNNETIFVFDDIYWSKGMTEAWEYIKAHNAITVTVDCFYLGFAFFRKEQVKEHFKIRV